MKMAKKAKKTQKIERHRQDIFGVANEIYVANTRKLKAFLGVLEEFIPFHRNEWKNTKIRTKSIKSRYERKFLFRFFFVCDFYNRFLHRRQSDMCEPSAGGTLIKSRLRKLTVHKHHPQQI